MHITFKEIHAIKITKWPLKLRIVHVIFHERLVIQFCVFNLIEIAAFVDFLV